MKVEEIVSVFKSFTSEQQRVILNELNRLSESQKLGDFPMLSRKKILDNRQGQCPHCTHNKYVKNGIDKGSQRYKCKSCHRCFTEYTGTWMAKLKRKDMILPYLNCMVQEYSLDKIVNKLGINKKTAFDWRHKVLASLKTTQKGSFVGITECDETEFRINQKGQKVKKLKARHRGQSLTYKRFQIEVVVTADRAGELDFSQTLNGKMTKAHLTETLGDRLCERTILCTDGSTTLKGFATDHKLEHHTLRADMKQFVRNKVYHIQHVNSHHNYLKKWIHNRFIHVSTKYLQQYLNWYRFKLLTKTNGISIERIIEASLQATDAILNYKKISRNYKRLISQLY